MPLTLPSHHMLPPLESWNSSITGLAERKAANEKLSVVTLTPSQTHSLHIASVTTASFSLVAGLITTYWFFRMRRSYRHDLIMLLIGGDMFQACWFFTFPAVELAHGTIDSTSAFCQASGFLLTLSIIASDVAIVLITIHTALYIFRGEQGLYPFRKYAYTILALYPILMCSLAFISKPAYVNTGQFCYLPVNPMWVRLALSWAPRYLTFATILSCSLAIYIYVKILMRRFGNVKNAQDEQPSIGSAFSAPARLIGPGSVPPTPSIDAHGLISSPASRRTSKDYRSRQYSISTMSTLNLDPPAKIYSSKFSRRSYSNRRMSQPGVEIALPSYSRRRSSEPDLRGLVVSEELATLAEVHDPESPISPTFSKAPTALNHSDESTASFWHRPFADEGPITEGSITEEAVPPSRSRTPSLPHIFTILGHGPETDSAASDTVIIRQQNEQQQQPALDATGLVRTRETIRRQVKHVFIYPVVYVAVWTLPFIVHLTSYGKGVPFGVRMASICCLCLHGFIDATIFSIKEKPWLHTRRMGHGFDIQWWGRGGGSDGMNTNAGRTREEMMTDGRIARQRRDRELADRQENQSSRKVAADWWDQDV